MMRSNRAMLRVLSGVCPDLLEGRRHDAHGDFDQGGGVGSQTLGNGLFQRIGTVGPDSSGPVGLRETNEIGVVQFGPVDPSFEAVYLVAEHIPEGIVVEDHQHHVDTVLHCGRQLLGVKEEAAVAGQCDHGFIRLGDFAPKAVGYA